MNALKYFFKYTMTRSTCVSSESWCGIHLVLWQSEQISICQSPLLLHSIFDWSVFWTVGNLLTIIIISRGYKGFVYNFLTKKMAIYISSTSKLSIFKFLLYKKSTGKDLPVESWIVWITCTISIIIMEWFRYSIWFYLL